MEYNQLNRYYPALPVFLSGFAVAGDELFVQIANGAAHRIGRLDVAYQEEIYTTTVGNSDFLATAVFKINDKSTWSDPAIVAIELDGKLLEAAELGTASVMQSGRSTHSLACEKHLYVQKLAKATGRNRREIKVIATDFTDYWQCSCGNNNLANTTVCLWCGTKKALQIGLDRGINEKTVESHKIFSFNSMLIAWLITGFLVNIIVQAFTGDFFVTNEMKNDFFGFFLRFIVPVLLVLLSIGAIIARARYWEKSRFVIEITRAGLLAAINVFLAVVFLLSAHTFLFLAITDVAFLILLGYQYRYKLAARFNYVAGVMIFCLLAIAIGKAVPLNKYTLHIARGGVHLQLTSTQADYRVPDEIDHIPVVAVNVYSTQPCNVQHLTLGAGVESFSVTTALALPQLQTIAVDEANPVYYVEDNLLKTKLTAEIWFAPIATRSLVVNQPELRAGLFKDLVNLEAVVLEEGVAEIGASAFENCFRLQTLAFPAASLKIIDSFAFANCEQLTTLAVPDSVEFMGLGVVAGCAGLQELTLPFIGEKREITASNARATDVIAYQFGSSLYLHTEKLLPVALKKLTITDITRIHNVTFYTASALETINLPDKVAVLGKNSFYRTSALRHFIVPQAVTTIPEQCFWRSGISEITLPAGLTTIEQGAFKECANLSKINFTGDKTQVTIDPVGNEAFLAVWNR